MKTIFYKVLILLTVLSSPAIAQNYKVIPNPTFSRAYGAAGTYTGWTVAGQGGSLGSASTSKSGDVSPATPTLTVPYVLQWGWSTNNTANDPAFTPVEWYSALPVGAPGPSPHGIYDPAGNPVDDNGIIVDPLTGIPLPGQPSKVIVPLENPFPDRGFGYDMEILDGDGNVIGSGHADLGPGETRNVPISNPSGEPFTVVAYPVADGNRGEGVSYPSTGGTGGGSGGSGPVVIDTTQPGKNTPVPQTPKPTTGETHTATQNAIDRLNNNVTAIGEAQRAQSLHLGNRIDAQTGVLGGKLDDIAEALADGGGGGATASQIQDALHVELKNNVTPPTDPDGVADQMSDAEDEGQGLIDKFQSVMAKMQTVKTKAVAMVTALGLNTSYTETELAFTVNIPRFGPMEVNAETDFGWFFDLLRSVELWVICILAAMAAIKMIREAFAN